VKFKKQQCGNPDPGTTDWRKDDSVDNQGVRRKSASGVWFDG